MNKDQICSLALALTLIIIMWLSTPTYEWQEDAVKHHAAHWQADPDGSPHFKWNDEPITEGKND